MNDQSSVSHNFFQMEIQYEDPCKDNQQHHDKSTNQLLNEKSHQQYINPFESPRKDNLFQFHISPKPNLFIMPHDSNLKKDRVEINPESIIQNKIDFELECNESDQASQNQLKFHRKPNRSSKNAKGLRNLSESVYTIVSELQITNYKQVANRLVKQIIRNDTQSQQFEKAKDQHNIKRRVYDALNVLIAAGLLRKKGKDVQCNYPYLSPNQKSSNSEQYRQKQKICQEIRQRQEIIKEKLLKLQKLQNKNNIIEYVLRRNKQQTTVARQSPQKKKNQQIRFPLVSMITEEKPVLEKLSPINEVLMLRLKQTPVLFGDVDMLWMMNKDHIQMDDLLKNICSEAPVKVIE